MGAVRAWIGQIDDRCRAGKVECSSGNAVEEAIAANWEAGKEYPSHRHAAVKIFNASAQTAKNLEKK